MFTKFLNLGYCFFSRVQFLIMSKNSHDLRFSVISKKCPPNFTSIHQFSLPSSTISPYFNSSYYSFLTFFTLYPILFNISLKKISPETQWGGFYPPNPPFLRPCVVQPLLF